MKKTLKTIQKEESRQRILNVASRLFRKQGFKTTGVDQLMHEAGLTAGAFYAHFNSKEDLFEQCLEHSLNESRKLLVKDTEHLTGLEKNQAILNRYCSEVHRDFPEKGCVLPSLAAEIYRSTDRSNILIAHYIEKWIQIICDNLTNDFSIEKKRTFAMQLISRSVGALLISRIVKDTGLSSEILQAARKVSK